MPPRHHRTTDRIVAILELVSRNRRGLSLGTISQELGAPKSSIQELTNGLTATGYLVERDRRFYLGAGPFVLTLAANRIAALSLRHSVLEQLYAETGHSIMAGIGVGDAVVYIDHVGHNPALEFVARNHMRRSLYATATGKIVLAAMQPQEMDSFLLSAPVKDRDAVQEFLNELPKIRSDELAYNYGSTLPSVAAVATPLYDGCGAFIASICAPIERERESELPAIGADLRGAVRSVDV